MRRLGGFCRTHKTLLLSIGFLTIFSFGVARATPPSSPYSAGATLDPQCAPGSSNCTVTAAPWTVSGNNVYYTTGNVGIGTTTPSTALTVSGVITGTSDAVVNGITVGIGAGSVATDTAVGYQTITANTSGLNLTAVGYQALSANTTGYSNVAVGATALPVNTTGFRDTAVGAYALSLNTTGIYDTAVGNNAMLSNTSGQLNVAFGSNALQSNTTGNQNSAVGHDALQNNTTGSYNIAIGAASSQGNTTGSYNIVLGAFDRAVSNTNSGQLDIGNLLYGTGLYQGTVASSTPITNGQIGIGTGTPKTEFDIEGDGSLLAAGTFGSGTTVPVLGAGARLEWIPSAGAFRVGGVDSTQWDTSNVGSYSMALGFDTTASALYSTALGVQTTASGSRSLAWGDTTTASGTYATAFGQNTTASGNRATAFGSGTLASKDYATAFGNTTTASGLYSTSFGTNATASGDNSTAFGNNVTASSYDAVTIGRYNTDGGSNATTWVATDPLFEVGNGTNGSSKSDAFEVLKNGNTSVGGTFTVTGLSTFSGGITTTGTTSDISGGANFFAVGGTGTTATTSAAALFGTATTVDYRTAFYGSTSSTLGVNDSYAGVLVASSPITAAATGTHDTVANMVIDPIGTVTNSGTVNRTASLMVYGPSGNNNNPNYALEVRGGILAVAGNSSGGSPQYNAFQLQTQIATFNDLYSAANSTTSFGASAVTFSNPTFTATNANVTYTNAATLTIMGAPSAGTNMTITNPMAIYVNSGMSAFTGGITTNVGNSISSGANFFARGTNVMTSTSTSAALFGGAGVTDYRAGFYGSFSSTMGVGDSYAGVIVASAPITTAASGTNAIAASMVVNPIGTVTAGGATLTNTAALYVSGAGSGGTNNYAFWVGSGLSQFGSSSVLTGTTVATFQNAGGSCNVVPSTSGGITCSSDMNLKKNITLLADNSNWTFNSSIVPVDGSMLSKVLALQPVDYNWKVEQDTDQKHAGFIAQDVQQIFPDLVTTDPVTHYLSLNYSGLMPYTVEAVKEMNANIINIDDLTKTNTWRDALLAWFADTKNGIKNFFSDTVTTKQLCVKDDTGTTCLTRSQVDQLLGGSAYAGTSGGSSTTTDTSVTTGQGSTQSPDTVSLTPDTSSQTTPSGNTQTPATN